MKKIFAIFLIVIIAINPFSDKMANAANLIDTNVSTDFALQDLALPDLGIEEKKIDYSNMKSIDNIINEMTDLSAQASTLKKESSTNRMSLDNINGKYLELEQQLFDYGVIKLSEESASKYVYGSLAPQLENASSSNVNYPTIPGIDFYISYYTWKESNAATTQYDFCRVRAVATPGYNGSKMVTIVSNVDMLKSITIADLAKNFCQIFTTNVKDNMVGNAITTLTSGKAEFAFSVLKTLAGDVWPTNSSTNFSALRLTATANSSVDHHWLKINGTYYFRIATQMASIEEQWTTIDTAGKIYTKQNSFRLFSENYSNPELIAIKVNNNVAYNCGQRYGVKTSSGSTQSKAYLTPFFASLPIQFVN